MKPSGLRVYIHKEKSNPFVESHTVDIGTGTSTVITYSRVHSTDLNRPSNPCDPNTTQKHWDYVTEFMPNRGDTGANLTLNNNRRSFVVSFDDYLVEHQQNELYKTCSCYTHTLPFKEASSKLCYYLEDPLNMTETELMVNKSICHDKTLHDIRNFAAHFTAFHRDKFKCDRQHYSISTSSTSWPNALDAKILLYNYVEPALKHVNVGGGAGNHLMQNTTVNVLKQLIKFHETGDSEDITRKSISWTVPEKLIYNNFAKLRVKASYPFTTHEEEVITNTLLSAVAEIGGILGLYCGISLLTLCELIELLVLLVVNRYNHRNL